MQNILKARPAGGNCADEVRRDYCHIEALVIITLLMELTGSVQLSSSAALLMFWWQWQPDVFYTSDSQMFKSCLWITERQQCDFSSMVPAVAFSHWSLLRVTKS